MGSVNFKLHELLTQLPIKYSMKYSMRCCGEFYINMYILQRGTFRNSMKIRVFPKGRPLDLSENTHISQGVYLGIA